MPAAPPKPKRKPVATPPAATLVRRLERQLARLARQLDDERRRHARAVAAVRRAADRRLASMMREIAALRHHEARADALARLLATRDADAPARVGDAGSRSDPV